MAKSAAAALHTEPKEPNFLQKFGHDFVHGDIFTKLSFFVWGLGYIGHGQLMKALLVTFVQGFALYFLAFFGVPNLAKFGTLGTVKMEMVFDVATMKNVVNDYDNSFEILLMSMISFIVIAALIAAAMMVVSSNYQLQKIREAGKKTNNFVQDINVYLNEKFYVTRKNGILLFYSGENRPDAQATVTCKRLQLLALMQGQQAGQVQVSGDATALKRLLAYASKFEKTFNVIEP